MTAGYTPSSAEGWALVDFMANVITDAQDAPHFTTAEHALMAAGELERGWLAAHDRDLRRLVLRSRMETSRITSVINNQPHAEDCETELGPDDSRCNCWHADLLNELHPDEEEVDQDDPPF